jgi:rubrerythrin
MELETVLTDCFWCGTAWEQGAYNRCPYCAATKEQGVMSYGATAVEPTDQ